MQTPTLRANTLRFRTWRGNWYSYDDTTGAVLSLGMAHEAVPAGHALRDRVGMDDRRQAEDQLSTYLQREGFRQLILVSTHRCNLRCLYCSYSGSYSNSRTHGSLDMSADVSRKAADMYLAGFAKAKRGNPYIIPMIGFYGGEPLLVPECIRETVRHFRRCYHGPIQFSLTTNAIGLDRSMARFLAREGFAVSVSLNGPRDEHDRLRIDASGAGSFSTAWRGLGFLQKEYGTHFREKCSVLACYDVGTNLCEVDGFFRENERWLPPLTRVSPVSPHFTDWYARYSGDEKKASARLLSRCREAYYSQLVDHRKASVYFDRLFGDILRMLLMRSQRSLHRPALLPEAGACIPGAKIAVSPSGTLHVCEKVSERVSIGDVEVGLSFPRILGLISRFRRYVAEECVECPITRLCPVCFALVEAGTGFAKDPPDLCSKLASDYSERFAELWSLLEAGVSQDEILTRRPVPK
jgi:uncharacterized protein